MSDATERKACVWTDEARRAFDDCAYDCPCGHGYLDHDYRVGPAPTFEKVDLRCLVCSEAKP